MCFKFVSCVPICSESNRFQKATDPNEHMIIMSFIDLNGLKFFKTFD